MRKLNYLVEIKGNELLLERFIEAIEDGTVKVDKNYPNPYLLDTGEKFLLDVIIQYYFQTRPFLKERYISFAEKLRKLTGFNSYYYSLGKQIEELILKAFPRVKKGKYKIFIPKTTEKTSETTFTDNEKELMDLLGYEQEEFRNDFGHQRKEKEKGKENLLKPVLTETEKELLSFLCYLAVSHIKYGPSYASVTANEYFDIVTQLGSDEVEKLKKFGTGKLSKELTNYKDSDLTVKANDVFATINLKLLNDNEESYGKALTFVNKLLQTDFPKSYEIAFSSKSKELLPVKGLPKCGQNFLFAGAVKYPKLHSQIKEYITLSKHKYEWYNNLEDENCAMPSTFAVLALGLQDEKYFDILIDYYKTVDEEHQSVQAKFTPAFLEKFGVTKKSIKVYVNAILSMQEHPHNKDFIAYFTTEESLKLLLDSKENFISYYFTEEDLKEYADSGNETKEMADYCWESVMYTTFGQSKGFSKIAKGLSEVQKLLFEKL